MLQSIRFVSCSIRINNFTSFFSKKKKNQVTVGRVVDVMWQISCYVTSHHVSSVQNTKIYRQQVDKKRPICAVKAHIRYLRFFFVLKKVICHVSPLFRLHSPSAPFFNNYLTFTAKLNFRPLMKISKWKKNEDHQTS